jgi:hypothetical protein
MTFTNSNYNQFKKMCIKIRGGMGGCPPGICRYLDTSRNYVPALLFAAVSQSVTH